MYILMNAVMLLCALLCCAPLVHAAKLHTEGFVSNNCRVYW